MALRKLSELTEHVRDHSSDITSARVARAANLVLTEMAREIGPVHRSTLTTSAPESTGTLTATQGSVDVTGSGTSFSDATDRDGLILISGDDMYFGVSSVSSTTALKLSSAWPAATASSKTYTLYRPYAALEEDAFHVLDIVPEGKAPLVRIVGDDLAQEHVHQRAGRPTHFFPNSWTNEGKPRSFFTPYPDARYALAYTYRKLPRLYDPDDTSSTTNFPRTHDDAIFYGTLSVLMGQEDNATASQFWLARFEKHLRGVKAEGMKRLRVRLGRAFIRNSGTRYRHGTVVAV